MFTFYIVIISFNNIFLFTDIDECKNATFCSSAKYECINTFGSAHCACRYRSEDGSVTCDETLNPPGWNIFNCMLTWKKLKKSEKLLNINSASFKDHAKKYAEKLDNILSLGFENKFYNLSLKSFPAGGPSAQYHVNVSSDTPHWFVRDFLIQVAEHYEVQPSPISVEDLNECVSGEAVCHGTALCENTYGGFKCICNGSVQLESQTCYKSDNVTATAGSKDINYNRLVIGLVLGLGIPLLLLLLALLVFCCCIRRRVKADIASTANGCVHQGKSLQPDYHVKTPVYNVHHLPSYI
ncbi:uncharacterized protein LOC129699638 [Leucoraja erinacea]|uniref:uncharacterized protein LOC129699638 n=1 Tax=Leucoraja erinaceus TaxID=7782 RepID=UPI002458465C|nr:uncharacterized protein LOC129699638 [Leucoraja erinacea]